MISDVTIPDGYSLLRNGKLRAKAGRGKTPYGMTDKMLVRTAQIRAANSRPKKRLGNDLSKLFQAISDLIADGCELAREGQKDRARNWWRLINNANLVSIFDNPLTQKISGITSTQSRQFASDLYRLKDSCHPETVPDWNTDISAIRYALEEILQQVAPKKSRAKKKFELAKGASRGGVLRIHPDYNSTPESPAPRSRSANAFPVRRETPATNFPWLVRQGLFNHNHK